MTTAFERATATRPDQRAAAQSTEHVERASRLRLAACQCGTVACALMTAVLFITFLPIVAIAYLAMWMDKHTEGTADSLETFHAPRRPR